MQQEEMRLRGDPFLDLHDNAAFVACAEPEVSVLITLYNYAHFIEECVASVEKAISQVRMRNVRCSLLMTLSTRRLYDAEDVSPRRTSSRARTGTTIAKRNGVALQTN